MPRKYTKITPEIVEKTKKYLADDRGFSKVEVARLVGISEHSLARIVQGYYDRPVEAIPDTQAIDSSLSPKATVTEIPFEKLEHLMKCECFIDELFGIGTVSDRNPDEIYFPRHYVHNMCNRYFPDKVDKILNDTNA